MKWDCETEVEISDPSEHSHENFSSVISLSRTWDSYAQNFVCLLKAKVWHSTKLKLGKLSNFKEISTTFEYTIM